MSKHARFIESLEGRQLMAVGPRVSSVSADNRGEVQINFTEGLSNVTSKTVRMFLAGADQLIGTADDVNAGAAISYVSKRKRIVIKKDLPAGTAYRIRVDDTVISSTTSQKLDGEFHNKGTSGDGNAGGSYSFQVKNDKGTGPKVRMYSNIGAIDLQLTRGTTPANVANFDAYVDSGRYDGLVVTRSVQDFIFQAGGESTTNNTSFQNVTPFAPAQGEVGHNSNLKYTISLALPGNPPDQNAGTNQWFINTGDNTNLDSDFTAFGTVLDNGSRAVVDAINNLSLVWIDATIFTNFQTSTGVPVASQVGLVGSDQTFTDPDSGQTVTRKHVTGGINAAAQFVYFAKMAQLMRIYGV